MNSIQRLFQEYSKKLQQLYPKTEAETLVLWLFEHYLAIGRKEIINNVTIQNLPSDLESALEALLTGKPIQYIMGKAPFYGRDFIVSPAVLIPRNETEELVHLIIKENPAPGLRILDIGTGSGCIPITLSLDMNAPELFSLDISEGALAVAKRNAEVLHSKVEFRCLDILQEELPYHDFDILVSNPPYVRHTEKELMHANVLAHEPHLALFVYDEDPLIFYRVIAQKAKKSLKSGGKLYFEINESFGEETKALLEKLEFVSVKIFEDLNGKERIMRATNP